MGVTRSKLKGSAGLREKEKEPQLSKRLLFEALSVFEGASSIRGGGRLHKNPTLGVQRDISKAILKVKAPEMYGPQQRWDGDLTGFVPMAHQ